MKRERVREGTVQYALKLLYNNKHCENIAWQYQVPYWLYVFLEV